MNDKTKREPTKIIDYPDFGPKPSDDTPVMPTPSRSWLHIDFSGFEPDDSRSSLLRRWVGRIRAVRSDGEVITIPINVTQSDGPLRIGEDIAGSFVLLEIYRTCHCTSSVKCALHSEVAGATTD